MLRRLSFCSLTGCAIGATLLLQTAVACGHHHRHHHQYASNAALSDYVAGSSLAGNGAQSSAAAARTLRQAYQLLSSTSESYQGHRVEAMRSIKTAAQLLGARLGRSRAKSSARVQQSAQLQGNSDSRLRRAEGMLEQVRGSVAGRSHQPVIQHVDEAIRHLTIALANN
jgi:hypothetical protein